MRVIRDATGRIGNGDLVHRFDGRVARLLARHVAVETESFGNLLADSVNGIERSHRVLKDHRDVVAANLAHALIRSLQ
jgi:hypothetical protein